MVVDYTGIRVVQEIRVGVEDDYSPVELINAYLRFGWVVLAIHQRGVQSDTVVMHTVYILGSYEANPRYPEDYSR